MTLSPADIVEIAARGGASSLALLMAISFARLHRTGWAARLGALFGLTISGYVLFSSTQISAAMGPVSIALSPLAIFSGVAFWWFASALFEDGFRWRWWRFIPVPITIVVTTIFFQSPDAAARYYALIVWQALILILMGHAVLLAVREMGDDLVEERRRFRVGFAVMVALTGIITTFFEVRYGETGFPAYASRLQSGVLLAIAMAISVWLQRGRRELLDTPPERAGERPSADGVPPEDAALARRLRQAMEDGAYRLSGLTLGALAQKLGAPEHRLRRVINQGLGYRNFTAFLNAYRLEDAKAALEDPENGRKQILMIALELGFGSIAPFNRAFKDETGMTPTAYRRKALSGEG